MASPAEPPAHLPARRGGRMLAATTAVVIGAVLAGCTADGGTPDDPRSAMQATGTPSPALSPVPGTPRDTRTISGPGFTMSVSPAFQESRKTSSNGEPALVLQRDSSVPQIPTGVVVLRDVDPEQDVVEQSYALELSKKGLQATDVSRSDVVWPNSTRAVLVQWTEQRTAGQTAVAVRNWQLNVQVSSELIFAVVGTAPAADFDDVGIGAAMATFRPTG